MACAVGTFAPDAGASTCSNCAPGTEGPSTGLDACLDCSPGTYATAPGTVMCIQCSCNDGNICTTDTCDPVSAVCSNNGECTPVPVTQTPTRFALLALLLVIGGAFALKTVDPDLNTS